MKTRVLHLGLTLLFSLGIASCNKEEYFEKEYLTPESTEGSDNGGQAGAEGGEGSTQGGVSGGVDGGIAGGSTSGSTGGTIGGVTTGGTIGGSTSGGSSTGGTVGLTTEIFRQAAEETKKLDIVWVIDDSGSMSDEQASLGANFSAFIDEFIAKNVDFKMGITTTDTSSATRKGKMVFGSDVKLTSAKAQQDPAQFKTDFRNLVNVGTYGSGTEAGLSASEGFMQKHAATFLRPDAYLAVVIVSDEEDQSYKTVSAYTDYLKTMKVSTGLVKVYSVVDVHHLNSGAGITVGSARYKSASNKTGGLIADIRENFHTVLTDMGNSIINLLDSFALANAPIAGSLNVYVNGVLSSNYTFDAQTHSIKFNPNSLPPVGAEIRVTYLK